MLNRKWDELIMLQSIRKSELLSTKMATVRYYPVHQKDYLPARNIPEVEERNHFAVH